MNIISKTILLSYANTGNDAPGFAVEFSGRLGNLMFEYAALLGICYSTIQASIGKDNSFLDVYSQTVSCAKITNPNFYDLTVPVSELITIFNWTISGDITSFNHRSSFQEHAEDKYAIRFDKDVFKQQSGTMLVGISFKIDDFVLFCFKLIILCLWQDIFSHGNTSIPMRSLLFEKRSPSTVRLKHPPPFLSEVSEGYASPMSIVS